MNLKEFMIVYTNKMISSMAPDGAGACSCGLSIDEWTKEQDELSKKFPGRKTDAVLWKDGDCSILLRGILLKAGLI